MPKFLSTDLPKLKDEEDDRSIKKSILDLLDKINTVADSSYPLGYVYTQYSGQTAPASLFGGTWTDITATSLPTQVYDSGSNANGSWIRYTDGTMMQWGIATITLASAATSNYFGNTAGTVAYGTNTFNLPQNFSSLTASFTTGGMGAGGATTVRVYSYTLSTFSMSATDVSTASGSYVVNWQAIGKWSSAPVYPVTLWKRTGGSLATTTGTSAVTGIYDSGTNSNGSWIRFTDGTMQCWQYDETNLKTTANAAGNVFFTASPTYYTYPIPFIANPSVTTGVKGQSVAAWSSGASITPTTFGLYTFSYVLNGTAYNTWSAIGKWK